VVRSRSIWSRSKVVMPSWSHSACARRDTRGSQIERGEYFVVVADDDVAFRPVTRVVVHTSIADGHHAHAARPGDVGPAQVADVSNLLGGHAEVAERVVEDLGCRLVPAHVVRERPTREPAQQIVSLEDAAQLRRGREADVADDSEADLPLGERGDE